MEQPKRTIVAGHICLDIIPSFTNIPQGKFFDFLQPGLMVQIGAPIYSTGGPVSNTGLALHILGIQTQLMGKVGQDMYGQAVCSLLREKGKHLAEGMIIDPGVTTSFTIIISPPGIDRMFLHHTGANDTYGLEDIDFHLVEQCALFHFGYPPVMRRMYADGGRELAEIFTRAKTTGATTSLDMCFPDPESEGGKSDWREILEKTLPYVDIFSPSIEELLFTLRKDTYIDLVNRGGSRFLHWITPELLADVAQEVIDLGAKIILLKLGEKGAYLRTAGIDSLTGFGSAKPASLVTWANQEIWAPCFVVEVVGTTGSGDATIAGFLSSLLRDGSPMDAITAAVAVGACNVEAADAISGLLSWEATQKRIDAGWQRRSFRLNTRGWEWDESRKLWIGPAREK